MQTKKITFNCDVNMSHEPFIDTYLEEVINSAKFDLSTPGNFEDVKEHVRTYTRVQFFLNVQLLSKT